MLMNLLENEKSIIFEKIMVSLCDLYCIFQHSCKIILMLVNILNRSLITVFVELSLPLIDCHYDLICNFLIKFQMIHELHQRLIVIFLHLSTLIYNIVALVLGLVLMFGPVELIRCLSGYQTSNILFDYLQRSFSSLQSVTDYLIKMIVCFELLDLLTHHCDLFFLVFF